MSGKTVYGSMGDCSELEILVGEFNFAWSKLQEKCPHRCPARDNEGQGKICIHPQNASGMEWCDPSYCPIVEV